MWNDEMETGLLNGRLFVIFHLAWRDRSTRVTSSLEKLRGKNVVIGMGLALLFHLV